MVGGAGGVDGERAGRQLKLKMSGYCDHSIMISDPFETEKSVELKFR
jgi:hypothetical protein